MTDIVDELRWRGVLAQTTDEDALRKALAEGPVTFYCGFDPTANSLHVGHLTQIIGMRRFQLAGHRPLALVGGATGLIGDPKPTAERSLNDLDTVRSWVDGIREQLGVFLDFAEDASDVREGDATGALLVDNYDWTQEISALEFLRDLGKHFSVNQMLARDTVKTRLNGEGMSYTEFSYVILQSFDYLELYRRYGCTLQFGGTDQWGNITAGLDLIRKAQGNEPYGPAHALTQNLLTKSDGTKFGKTEGGTVWLDPELTSPYAFYQFWLNSEDADVGRFLRTFSFRTRAEIEELERLTQERPAARSAQRALAEELTTLVHGEAQTAQVIAASQALFGRGALRDLDASTLSAALEELPRTQVSVSTPITDLLVATGLVQSKSAARRTVRDGGAYLNNTKVLEEDALPDASDVLHGRWLVLRRGKRNLAAVEVRPQE